MVKPLVLEGKVAAALITAMNATQSAPAVMNAGTPVFPSDKRVRASWRSLAASDT